MEKIFSVAVIGGGPAGMMAAIQAAQHAGDVLLIERNPRPGRKLLITGKGRCNVTNMAPVETFVERFGKQGRFLKTAFYSFTSQDLVEFFRKNGLEMKIERQGRVFPVTDRAESVLNLLEKVLLQKSVKFILNTRVLDIIPEKDHFRLITEEGTELRAFKVIITAGGASFKTTGSTGDSYEFAKKTGHTVTPLFPALVPLKTAEKWVKDLQGLGLEKIKLTFEYCGKRHPTPVGELMFTHFGVSGPLVLDRSGHILEKLKACGSVKLYIDMKPGLTMEELDSKLIRMFEKKGLLQVNTIMQEILPKRMADVFLDIIGVDSDTRASQITRKQRQTMIRNLKNLPLTITGSLPLEEGMTTAGGVSTEDINPRTMESRKVPGLYFAGEAIEGAASSGGYHLQQAFSTGWLAGNSAGEECKKMK